MGKEPCKHLERLLPRVDDGGSNPLKRVEYQEYENSLKGEELEYEKQARKLEKSLKKFGLEPFRADLLMDRYVSNLTLKEIQIKRHFLDIKAVNRLIKETLKIMSESGVDAAKSLLKEYS